MSDVSGLGVYRGRARDEDVWSFSDRPGIPELKLVGVRAGVGQCPRRDRIVLRLKDGAAQRVRVCYIMIMRGMKSEGGTGQLECSFSKLIESRR